VRPLASRDQPDRVVDAVTSFVHSRSRALRVKVASRIAPARS
jgi:hypothetical protein